MPTLGEVEPLIYQVIKGRRSVRKYLKEDVPEDALGRALEAATWAPSAHNAQPWRFIVIKDESIKHELAKSMAKEWDKDLAADGLPLKERERLTRSSIERLTEAPILILACSTMKAMHAYPDERRMAAERTMAVQSVAAAVQNLLLALHVEGLGACWICAPLFCQDVVREALRIPKDVEPQALITVGRPAESPKPPSRRPLGDIVHLNRWGTRWEG